MARRRDGVTGYLSLGVVVAAGLVALALSPSPSNSEVPAAPPPVAGRVVAAPSLRVGNAGCAATACHGGPAPSLTAPIDAHAWLGSATHWQARDPHTRAYDALESTLAADMMARLRVPKPAGGFLKATEFDRCLACHTDPQLVGKPGVPAAALAQGIGCESCHGHAERYLRDHTTWRSPAERAAGSAATGLAPLNDLGRRAAACAGCHVGAPSEPGAVGGSATRRDMNHDMIAAGHPRLDGFDFAESQRRLTPHWFEKDRTRPGSPPRGPDAEWRTWLVGRVACGEAAARRLADRAAHGVWPELAESDCRGCHHAVPGPERPVAVGKLGAMRWQSAWPLTGGGLAEASELESLSAWMGTTRAPAPVEVGRRASAAAGQLAAWRDDLAHADGDLRPLARRVFPPSAAGLDIVGVLSGLAALERADGPRTPTLRSAIERFLTAFSEVNSALDDALRDARR